MHFYLHSSPWEIRFCELLDKLLFFFFFPLGVLCAALSSPHRPDSIRKRFANEFPAHPQQCFCVAYVGDVIPGLQEQLELNKLFWVEVGKVVLQEASRAILFSATRHALLSTFADSCCWRDFLLGDCSQQLLQIVSSSEERGADRSHKWLDFPLQKL